MRCAALATGPPATVMSHKSLSHNLCAQVSIQSLSLGQKNLLALLASLAKITFNGHVHTARHASAGYLPSFSSCTDGAVPGRPTST